MKDVVIIGGGLAGLVSALHLRQAGLEVLVIEKKSYPFHKVCGEYISNEVVAYLESLKVDFEQLNPRWMSRFLFTAPSGKSVETTLPLGGFSIRRYTLDNYLYELASSQGVQFHLKTTVEEVQFEQDQFRVDCLGGAGIAAWMVIGSYGKRANLDRILERPFFLDRSGYVGVKNYYEGDFPDDQVAIHNFAGGYCGLSQVENGLVNVAYLSTRRSLRRFGSLEALEQNALASNPHLHRFFQKSRPVWEKPLVISNISFARKDLIEGEMLMCGDSAGMIPPICGNGMAMAIHSAKILSELLVAHFQGNISRQEVKMGYYNEWNRLFRTRLFWGRQIQRIMGKPGFSDLALAGLQLMPGLLPPIIRQTHGKVF